MLTRLFVYGTLRRSYRNKYARHLHASATYLGKARMQGRKIPAGKYFGLVPALTESDWVEGDVFDLREPESLFTVLDSYEGPNYPRQIQPAKIDTGEQLDCWVYLYAPQIGNRLDQA